jgi:putative nucleotidyltransferase-like protein
MTAILPSIVDEGERLINLAHGQGVTLALLGGVAVRLLARDIPPALDREYKDLDFAVPKGRGRDASKLLTESGYEPEVSFNAMNGNERLLFHDLPHARQVDVFVGSFRMCHVIPLTERLSSEHRTVPLAELMLTKLQIIELNEKDVRDTLLLFHTHDVGDSDVDVLNAGRIAELCAGDWGLWRTITHNLERCRELTGNYDLPETDRRQISDRIGSVLERIESEPKSRGWKLRAKIGERKRWYELPEEVV